MLTLENKVNLPSVHTPIIKTLTPAEMKERREKDLCYNYDEKWIRGHKCKT